MNIMSAALIEEENYKLKKRKVELNFSVYF